MTALTFYTLPRAHHPPRAWWVRRSPWSAPCPITARAAAKLRRRHGKRKAGRKVVL